MAPTDEITTREASVLLGLDPATINRYVKAGRLTPSRKLPGHTGAYLFWRADILRVVADRAARATAS